MLAKCFSSKAQFRNFSFQPRVPVTGVCGMPDWKELQKKLPYQRPRLEERKKMFSEFDVQGNGYISLAEADKGIRDVLQLEELFDAKPAIMRAFQASKNYGGDPGGLGVDYIQKREFRIFLQFLHDYFELYEMFEAIDTSCDRRVDLGEFKKSVESLSHWGITLDDPEAEFNKIDSNDGGLILFAEFCKWAIAKHLDLDPEDDD